jgi:hypothetical protein
LRKWKELTANEVWTLTDFLPQYLLNAVLSRLDTAAITLLDSDQRLHAVGSTYYNYNVFKSNIRDDRELIAAVFEPINELMRHLGEHQVDTSVPLLPIQFFAKSFDKSKSRYDLHAESEKFFGKFVFVHYLSDESSGELIFPTEVESEEYITINTANRLGWEDTKRELILENNPMRYAGPLTVLPNKNMCVLFRTGTAHYVNPVKCSKNIIVRPCLSGWIHADDRYLRWERDQKK